MTIREQLNNSLKDAMRSGDEVRKRAVRQVLSAIKLAEVGKTSIIIDDAAVIALIQKEIKSCSETIEDARKAGREDLIEAAKAEIKIFESFLPQQLSTEELESLVRLSIEEVNASLPTDMGKVMKALMPRVQGRATGDQVSQAVKRLLMK